ncbi:MAG: PBP1A family penicillin-binding protein [Proteobacteria bacterium]|nr:PBP1A family penicillin-binding protein [Pseudomonadota bacterium]
MKFILKWGFIFSIWIATFAALALLYYLKDLPSLKELEAEKNKQVIEINYSNSERITNFGGVYGSEIDFYELPPNLINAVIATEDRRFFSHYGVDFFGVIRALMANHQAGHVVQGGSTITQQLAKLLFLKPDRNFKRKIQELLLAIQLERNFTKEQILSCYLNRAYFGAGNYGVGNAAKYYFGKNVSRINLNEAAMLAGLLKAPSKLSPKNNQDLAEARASQVLQNMAEAGFLKVKNLSEVNKDISYKVEKSQRLYFADLVHDQFKDFISKQNLDEQKIIVTTTLDEKIQAELEEVENEFVEKNSKKIAKSEIAVVVMSKQGAVVAMSGGKDYQQSQFNRAVHAKRQAGSAFKTFVYLTAFENGAEIDDEMEDKKINFGVWLPENYNNHYVGQVTLKRAFAESLNSVAVQLATKQKQGEIAKTAHRLGIVSKVEKNDLTIALGTTEVSLLELTSAYATIANNGEAVIPHFIYDIRNGEDKILYNLESSGLGQVISESAQEKIKQVLRAVVESGTGKNANVANNIYGKTGTSQDFRDAWFIGFNDDYVIGVWIGNDDNSSTNKITGGSLPAQLFGEILKKL